jgi:hypothetical protein
MIGVQTGDAQPTIGQALGGFSGLIVCSANLPDKIAIAVDTQVDDGAGATGSVRGAAQTAPNMSIGTTGTPPVAAYAETGTNVYVLCRGM